MKEIDIIGKRVYIIDKESIYYGEWGIVEAYVFDLYYIAIANRKCPIPVFDRTQFRVGRE